MKPGGSPPEFWARYPEEARKQLLRCYGRLERLERAARELSAVYASDGNTGRQKAAWAALRSALREAAGEPQAREGER